MGVSFVGDERVTLACSSLTSFKVLLQLERLVQDRVRFRIRVQS